MHREVGTHWNENICWIDISRVLKISIFVTSTSLCLTLFLMPLNLCSNPWITEKLLIEEQTVFWIRWYFDFVFFFTHCYFFSSGYHSLSFFVILVSSLFLMHWTSSILTKSFPLSVSFRKQHLGMWISIYLHTDEAFLYQVLISSVSYKLGMSYWML